MSTATDPGEWIRFARDDLAAARVLLADPALPARLACFHVQQAAEKALKAALLDARVAFRRTHDLAVLVALVPEGGLRAAVSRLDIQLLQQWAVDARYPADLPEATGAEAQAILRVGEQVVAAAATAISGGAF